jgi:hypothetical protein
VSDIAEFLLDRIAEDEGQARRHLADADREGWGSYPHRVLAEYESKRRIVELHDHPDGSCWEMHRGVYGPGWPEGSYAVEGQPWAHPSLEPPEVHPGPCETLQLLALPYADHPDYDNDWAP